jgi:hypothetical protein
VTLPQAAAQPRALAQQRSARDVGPATGENVEKAKETKRSETNGAGRGTRGSVASVFEAFLWIVLVGKRWDKR